MIEAILAISPSTIDLPDNRKPLRKRMLGFCAFVGGLIGASAASESYLGLGKNDRLDRRTFFKRIAGSYAAGAAAGGTLYLTAEDLPVTIKAINSRLSNVT